MKRAEENKDAGNGPKRCRDWPKKIKDAGIGPILKTFSKI